ncbi:MAG TPA: GNAT family N-acetyltransferase [Methylomusa anaerophila]|uniref:Acetyltransferase (GNAT) family protein n=1 Tax=Methylomusa anaerophila TaxID=1930071 RepID=A0A348AF46_9FIRM|nr:GNAT family N-acetyltransferase [Methylomusa anaerophila]BBB89694.1 acetyltransferase (GNAT) family protein [Methylomusa anaerophila]HML89262.1 GNAT family N-acetyltransferase [Methylomusa anaerophila]
MSSVKYRETTMDDLDLLVKLRIDFILDIKPCNDSRLIAEVSRLTKDYFSGLIAKNQYFGFIGFIDEKTVCGAGLFVYSLPPLYQPIIRTQGHVLNVFTYPEYRSKGYGKGLMDFIIEKAKEKQISRLFLNATKMGEPLYGKCGFAEPEDKAMILRLI